MILLISIPVAYNLDRPREPPGTDHNKHYHPPVTCWEPAYNREERRPRVPDVARKRPPPRQLLLDTLPLLVLFEWLPHLLKLHLTIEHRLELSAHKQNHSNVTVRCHTFLEYLNLSSTILIGSLSFFSERYFCVSFCYKFSLWNIGVFFLGFILS